MVKKSTTKKVSLKVPKKFDLPNVVHKGYRQNTGDSVGKGFFDGNVGNNNAKYLKDMAD